MPTTENPEGAANETLHVLLYQSGDFVAHITWDNDFQNECSHLVASFAEDADQTACAASCIAFGLAHGVFLHAWSEDFAVELALKLEKELQDAQDRPARPTNGKLPWE